jgi:hypothetical protein
VLVLSLTALDELELGKEGGSDPIGAADDVAVGLRSWTYPKTCAVFMAISLRVPFRE